MTANNCGIDGLDVAMTAGMPLRAFQIRYVYNGIN